MKRLVDATAWGWAEYLDLVDRLHDLAQAESAATETLEALGYE